MVVSDWIGRDQLSRHLKMLFALMLWIYLTDDVPIRIAVLKVPNGFDRGDLQGTSSCCRRFSKVLSFFESAGANVQGCAS